MKLNVVPAGLGKTELSGVGERSISPIDLVHLSRQSLGDEALANEILLVFIEAAQTFLRRIMMAAAPNERVLHLRRLRLAANGVGAVRIADAVLAVEREMVRGHGAAEGLADLGFAVEEVAAFVEAQAGQLAA